MYDDLTLLNLTVIYSKLEKSTLDDETSLLILDDVGASLKNNSIQTLLRKLIYNRRHLKTHIIILLQSFMSVPKEVRKLFNNLIVLLISYFYYYYVLDDYLMIIYYLNYNQNFLILLYIFYRHNRL
jgi:hypothetical protein